MSITCTDQEFINSWNDKWHSSPTLAARSLGISLRAVQKRREGIENRYGILLKTIKIGNGGVVRPIDKTQSSYVRRNNVSIPDGVVVVFSDAHWWPGQARSEANKALLKLLPKFKPHTIIANGDILDGAAISRHEPLGWVQLPTLEEEIACVVNEMRAIQEAVPKARRLRTIGNHDIRYDKRLAEQASEYRGLIGMRLSDHLPDWEESWSICINDNIIVKHRWHNGVHAQYNNTLKGGMTIVTGHLHRLLATPHTDYRGRRWGIDCGTLSSILEMPQFDYAEDNPLPWGSGFAVLTIRGGTLLPPEFCEVIGGKAYFRGEEVK